MTARRNANQRFAGPVDSNGTFLRRQGGMIPHRPRGAIAVRRGGVVVHRIVPSGDTTTGMRGRIVGGGRLRMGANPWGDALTIDGTRRVRSTIPVIQHKYNDNRNDGGFDPLWHRHTTCPIQTTSRIPAPNGDSPRERFTSTTITTTTAEISTRMATTTER